ncbi:LTA synthase family protein [Clostridium cuniculi]|uniref:LTA synthase family protein n=1 Tax=Clostridium cuniculi TaxID=2548455 RepID=UPI0011DC8B2C|nr:LTA synthase family protein [Clostridium cuniculi]
MKNRLMKIIKHPFIWWILTAIIVNFFIEVLSRQGISGGISYWNLRKETFIYNTLIIMLSTSWIFLAKKKYFWLIFISFIWVIGGIANSYIIKFRGSPLTAIDLSMARQAIPLAINYLGIKSIIIIVFTILLLLGFMIFIWKKENATNRISWFSIFPILLLVAFPSMTKYAQSHAIVARDLTDLFYSYKEYGFPYSFMNTVLSKAMTKPDTYSKDTIDEIVSNTEGSEAVSVSLNNNDNTVSYQNPNIIILQLETFFDPLWVKALELDNDPIPNFRKLSEEYSSGLIHVPVIGGGTANTEFETITGLSLDYFSSGQFPYNNIMKKNVVPTIAYSLSDIGYKTHGIHNHEASFYDRYKVYANMGFDTFTAIENMSNYDRNETGWCKDKILTSEIMDILNSTEESDFVYAVSVQGHGSYPGEDILNNKYINVTGEMNESLKNQWEYYVNQIYEMDMFISELVESIESLEEPTVLALFGDHLPGLSLKNEDLTTNDIYITPYVIYNNFGLEKEDLEIEAYQLTSIILDRIELEGGLINKFHILNMGSDSYEEDFANLEYDILYGKKYAYDQIEPYKSTEMKLGFRDIQIDQLKSYPDGIHVEGYNFTINSKVFVNGKQVSTEYLNSNTLRLSEESVKTGDLVYIKQLGRNSIVLGTSNEYIVK